MFVLQDVKNQIIHTVAIICLTLAVPQPQPILYKHVNGLVILWLDLNNKTHNNVKQVATEGQKMDCHLMPTEKFVEQTVIVWTN